MSGSSFRFTGKWIGQRYCIEQELGRGGMGAVYRAFHIDDPSNDVAIKLIHRSQKMTSSDLLRFQKEAALMSQLYHSNIIAFHELGIFSGEDSIDFSDGYYIVMDYARGKNLKDSLTDDGRKDLAFLFQVGLQVADALDYTHGKNIIHRDIKPHNIIISQTTGDGRGVHVRVLDFGVARLGDAIGKEDGSTEEKAGTPLYMAPEQSATGFGVSDHRVDLYSLGCVLYEILTGHPPFSGENREELERAHQFAEAEPIQNLRPDVPLVVSQIIQKLLAKRPDDRYQTAFSLTADLLRAKALWEQKPRSVPSFPLALKDAFYAVSAQLPIQGREKEIQTILNEYKQVAEVKARGRITVVSGAPGIGKTRVLNEFRGSLASQRIVYLNGLFTQHENALPFNALANAFNELLVKIAKTAPVEADLLSRRIKQVIGSDAHLVASVVPGLKPFLTDIPEPDDGIDIEGEKYARFTKAFSDFTKSLVPETQPLVMILDDVHWADEKSLALIDQFFSNANSMRFQLVIGCRLDLAGPDSPFMKFITKFRGLKLRYAEVNLTPLSVEATQGVIGAMLRQTRPVSLDLVEHMMQRSSGIPMRIVEIARRMVALDFIRLNIKERGWEWDIKEIKNAKVTTNAVDLVLGRIGEYKGSDLSVLRAAACCGTSFQYETLLLGGRNTPTSVMRLIDRAIDDGLLVRSPEPSDLKHLGKAYVFVHKKVRDAIYDVIEIGERRELHGFVASQLLASIEKPKDQILFSLALHLNLSRGEEKVDLERERLALKFNLEAGDAMRQKQGWTAANNYYHIALEIIDSGRTTTLDNSLRRKVIERLADVNASQTNFKIALKRYNELLSQPMNRKEYTAAAAKAAQLHIVCGNVSEAVGLIAKGLAAAGVPMPMARKSLKWLSLFRVFFDILTTGTSYALFVTGLKKCWLIWRKKGEATEQLFAVAKLHYLMSIAAGRQSHLLSSIAHDAARACVVNGEAPISMAIKIAADRAALLSRFGAVSVAYKLFDMGERLARESKYTRSAGYVLLMRAMSIDYLKGRFEDVSLHLKEASQKIDREQDRLAYAQMIVFRQYIDMMNGNLLFQDSLNADLRLTVPTRNWLSPMSMAILMTSLLLQGKRQRMVMIGEDYNRRRKAVGGRDDLFSNVVLTLSLFARGEDDQTRISFAKIAKQWLLRNDKESLNFWQEDFLGMFMLLFPVLFEVENGKQLMAGAESGGWLAALKSHTDKGRFFTSNRTVKLLVKARINEMLGAANVKQQYDFALQSSKTEGTVFVQILSYMWFGAFLIRAGNPRRADYLNIALKLANERSMNGVTSHLLKIMEKMRIKPTVDVAVAQAASMVSSATSISGIDPISQNLDHLISALNQESAAVSDFANTFEIIKGIYGDVNIKFIFADFIQTDPILVPGNDLANAQQSLKDVAPYFTIRSTLILHLQTGSVVQIEPVVVENLSSTDLGETLRPGGIEEDLASTQIIGASAPDVTAVSSNNGKDVWSGIVSNVERGQRSQQGNGMTALIPVRAGGETIGLVVVDNVIGNASVDMHRVKRDLDTLGAHLGVLLTQKFDAVSNYLAKRGRAIPRDLSVTGGSYFDEVEWLDIQMNGKLRKEREASWYLGLRWAQDQYLVVYCCIKGDAMDRDRLAAQILYQLFIVRELATMLGQARSEIVDLRSQLMQLLNNNGLAGKMDEILLSYSLFEKGAELVASGHYGASRPVVLGAENRVTAFNQASLRLRDGRDLKYWEVFAPMGKDQVYLVSYDTSRIDGASFNFVNEESPGNLIGKSQGLGVKNATKMLETAHEQRVLPRYYLAITRRIA